MALFGEIGFALVSTSNRAIGTFIPDVVIEEVHRDSLVITQHPVEKGAAITDHAFLRPAEVDIRCGFSASSHFDVGYPRLVYEAMRNLQATRRPFTVFTGKRAYRDMLIADLGVTTEARTENVLAVAVRLQQIIIVSTQTTGTGTTTTQPGAGQGSQGLPQSTDGVQNKGEQQASGVGQQDFIGGAQPSYNSGNPSFNPGGFDTTGGGTLGNGSFGLDGVSANPEQSITLDEITVENPAPIGNTGGGSTNPYDIWEFG